MRIVVTGGTGFTGERVVRRLAGRGVSPTVVARASSLIGEVRRNGANVIIADLDDQASLQAAFKDHQMLIHVASMGFGQIPAVVAAAKAAGIRRAVFVSTTAVLTSLPVRSKPIRTAAEECVRGSGLEWTILRPTMIYGSSRDRNMSRLLQHLRRWRIAPIPGRGTALQQPVHVDDVADAIVEAAFRPIAVGREYVTSGARPMTLRELINHAAGAIRVTPVFVSLPTALAAFSLRGIERLGLRLPIRAEQIDRLCEDKAFDHSDTTTDLGYQPRCFSEGIRQEAVEIGLVTGS